MGGNQRGFLEVTVRTNMIQMLMSIEDHIDIFSFEAQIGELLLKVQVIIIQTRIDQDIPGASPNKVAVASAAFSSQEVDPLLNLFSFLLHRFLF
jgi:hypothetical protein